MVEVQALLPARALGPVRRAKRRLVRLFKPPRFEKGCPPDLAFELVRSVIRERFGDEAVSVSHQHISGWKQAGAFRLIVGVRRGFRSIIYKNAIYGEEEIAGLRGLPVTPGPPEYLLYSATAAHLGRYLPEVYTCREVTVGRHYQYLMEDLSAAGYVRRSRDERRLLLLCEQLPAIQAAIGEALGPPRRDLALQFDRHYSVRLLAYAEGSLRRLFARHHSARLKEVLTVWNPLSRLYREVLETIHAQGRPGPLHGDLNVANILFHEDECARVKLIDWEWAGFGVPHSDLASLLKFATPDLEARALAVYEEACRRRPSAYAQRVYQWCKLQRGLLDAAFMAKEKTESRVPPKMNLEDFIERALGRALQSFHELTT